MTCPDCPSNDREVMELERTIDLLRKDIDNLRDIISEQIAAGAKVRAQRDRYEAALRKINGMDSAVVDVKGMDAASWYGDIARSALDG